MTLSILDIIYVPLAYILKGLYWLIGDYGWSILAFALLTKLLLVPVSINGEKNRLKMNAIQPKMRRIQEKYHNDTRNPKYQQEVSDLYAKEGYNPMSGCLPLLIQMPLIFGLWNAIRRPLSYVCNFSEKAIQEILEKIFASGVDTPIVQKLHSIFDGKDFVTMLKTNEIYIAQAIEENVDTVDGLKQLTDGHMLINTKFLGIDLGATAADQKGWFLLIPVIAAVTSLLASIVSSKINQNPDQKKDPTAKSMNAMMYTMPLLSLWIGYSMNFGVALYWISSNILSLIQTILLPLFFRKKEPEPEPVKEKKLNYTQIEKMKRDGTFAESDSDEIPKEDGDR